MTANYYGESEFNEKVTFHDEVKFFNNVNLSGNVIGVINGDVVGNLTGNVSGDITSAGISTFSSLRVSSSLYDGNNIFGASGQILSSDGTKTAWINASGATVGSATSVGTNLDSTNVSRFVTFVETTSGNNIIRVDSDLTYNPSTNTLTAGTFSGTTFVGVFPAGTLMLFQQTAAPTGWTKQTTHNNKALRVVSGAAGSGGSTAFTSVFAARTPTGSVSVSGSNSGGSVANTTVTGSVSGSNSGGSVSNTTLTTSEMPSHNHSSTSGQFLLDNGGGGSQGFAGGSTIVGLSPNTTSTGGGNSHGHGFTNPTWSGSVSMNAHNHTFTNPSWSGSASFSGSSMDFAVQYVDLIIASKN